LFQSSIAPKDDRNLTANLVGFMRSFGEHSHGDLPKRGDYLPFRFIDLNSPKCQLQRKIAPRTLDIVRKLISEGKMPPRSLKVLYGVEGMMELLQESKN
jgi:hypothetical protein